MASVDYDIALLTIAILASDTVNTEDEPVKNKQKSQTIWEMPWLAHRTDPNCENVYMLMLRLREVIIIFINSVHFLLYQ